MKQINTKSEKKILKISISYTFTEGLQKSLFFLITPILTIYITPKEYGNIAIILMLVAIFKILFTMSLESTIMRYYLRIKDNKTLSKNFLGSIVVFISLLFMFSFFIMLFFGEELFSIILVDIQYYPYIFLAIILVISQELNSLYITVLKVTQNVKDFTIFYNMYFFSQTIFILLFVVNDLLSEDIAYALALITVNLLFSLISIYKLKPYICFTIDLKLIKIALAYSISMVPIQLANIANSSVDRYVLLSLMGTSSVGIYFFAYQISTVALLIMLAINSAFVPLFFKLYDNNKKKKNYTEIYTIADKVVLASGIVESILLLSYPIVFLMIDRSYASSLDIVPILIFSNILMSLYFLNTNALSVSKKLNRKKIVGIFLGILLNVILSYTLIEYIGIKGVAIATLVGFMTSTLYFSFLVKKFTALKYSNFLYFMYYFLIFISVEMTEEIFTQITLVLVIILSFYSIINNAQIKRRIIE
jgi:O-antigen/teichoic acid export membrane protein